MSKDDRKLPTELESKRAFGEMMTGGDPTRLVSGPRAQLMKAALREALDKEREKLGAAFASKEAPTTPTKKAVNKGVFRG